MAAAAAAGALTALLAPGGTHHPLGRSAPRPSAAAPAPAAPVKGLQLGLSESNANLLWSRAARPQLPVTFARWRDLLAALHPAYLRLVLDWAQLQPTAGAPVQLAGAADGCMRGAPPCLAYGGLRDVFAAIRSQQQAEGGFVPIVVIDGAPAWAAGPAQGCEAPGTTAVSRPIRASALAAYRKLIRTLLGAARAQGLDLPLWSAWNEPNHPFFLSPQRARCAAGSPSLAVGVYAQLARAMAGVLGSEPGHPRMLLGELAGFTGSGPRSTGIGEFVRDLPGDVVCQSPLWSVHSYPRAGPAPPGADPVGALEEALAARGGCARDARIWVTETGAGSGHEVARASLSRAPAPLSAPQARAACRRLAASLLRWYRDPRVDVAIQYTFRADSLFPVGLADPALGQVYPAYHLLAAWAGSRPPSAPPPALPAQCA